MYVKFKFNAESCIFFFKLAKMARLGKKPNKGGVLNWPRSSSSKKENHAKLLKAKIQLNAVQIYGHLIFTMVQIRCVWTGKSAGNLDIFIKKNKM